MRAIPLAILAALTLAAAGCGPSATERRLTALEDHFAALEASRTNLVALLLSVQDIVSRWDERQSGVISNLATAGLLQEEKIDDLQRAVGALQRGAANRSALVAVSRPGVPRAGAPPAAGGGVPPEVYQQIAAEAARMFPTDYDEQIFVINKQVEAYRKLHP